MSKFSDILNTPADSIEAPQPTPEGTWRFAISSVTIKEPESEDEAGTFLFGLKPLEPEVDVETGDFVVEDAQEWLRFWVQDKRSAWRVRRFLEHTGVDLSGTLEDAAKAAENHEFMAMVAHEPNKKDPDGPPYVRLSDFAPV